MKIKNFIFSLVLTTSFVHPSSLSLVASVNAAEAINGCAPSFLNETLWKQVKDLKQNTKTEDFVKLNKLVKSTYQACHECDKDHDLENLIDQLDRKSNIVLFSSLIGQIHQLVSYAERKCSRKSKNCSIKYNEFKNTHENQYLKEFKRFINTFKENCREEGFQKEFKKEMSSLEDPKSSSNKTQKKIARACSSVIPLTLLLGPKNCSVNNQSSPSETIIEQWWRHGSNKTYDDFKKALEIFQSDSTLKTEFKKLEDTIDAFFKQHSSRKRYSITCPIHVQHNNRQKCPLQRQLRMGLVKENQEKKQQEPEKKESEKWESLLKNMLATPKGLNDFICFFNLLKITDAQKTIEEHYDHLLSKTPKVLPSTSQNRKVYVKPKKYKIKKYKIKKSKKTKQLAYRRNSKSHKKATKNCRKYKKTIEKKQRKPQRRR